jgi:superfamily II DNA or RNA helicase
VSLRDYQQAAIDALERDWSTGLLRLGISLPTGTGKTHVMAELADQHASTNHYSVENTRGDAGRVLILVHRDTLVEQTERKMREHASPGVTVGVVKAERDVVGAHIIVASVHTLRSEKRLARIPHPDLIIVDEAHVSMSPTYARVFARFPNARVAGFSATWVRSDSAKLGDFYQKISFQRSIRWAIKNSHLVLPRGVAVGMPENLQQNLAGLRTTRGGDYKDTDLEELVSVNEVRENVTRGYLEHAAGRSAVLFAPTVAAAEYFRQGLNAAGIAAAGIYNTTGPRDRRRTFSAYRARQIMVLTTCTALAEGWDAPWCSAALMVRPTKHIGLYVQQVGRVLRPWPGKSDAVVLDLVGTLGGMSLSLEAVLRQTEERDDDEDEREERDPLDPGPDEEKLFKVGVGSKPVDLFAGTDARWLVTEHGVPFIATSTHYYFVCQPPDCDTWNVGTCAIDTSMRNGRIQNGRWLRQGITSGEAIEFASVVAVDDDPQLARADAPWRSKGKPSQSQIYRARSIGCVLSEQDNRGAVADKLTVRQASIVLAPVGAR